MSKKLFFIAITLLWALNLMAQQEIKFSSELRVGLLFGENNYTTTEVSSINGLKYKTWFSGIGVSFDQYGIKHSYPLYLDLQKNLSTKRKTFFVFVDGGLNFPLKNSELEKNYWIANYKVKAGGYYQAGAGYKFPVNKSDIGLSLGYSVKEYKESYNQVCDFCVPSQPAQTQSNQYVYRRITFKLNYRFL